MHLIMFDIDGTLIDSDDFDSTCFTLAVSEVLDCTVDTHWERYEHVSDLGILMQIAEEIPGKVIDDSMVSSVKSRFLYHLNRHIETNGVKEIPGASQFINYLLGRDDVVVSLATGGWYESAVLKLTAAGIDPTKIPIASSSDHYSRSEIMKVSENSTKLNNFSAKTYFGDGEWDQRASMQLDYQFVLVGNRIKWSPSIDNYLNTLDVVNRIGL